jgi:predicted Zn-dependent protease
VTGNREVVFMSIEGEKELGAENAKQVEEQMGLVDDPKLVSYIESIGQRLAKHSPYQDVTYQFQVVMASNCPIASASFSCSRL